MDALPAIPTGGRGTVADATLRFDDGTTRVVSVRGPHACPAAILPRALVLATPDRAGAETLGDLLRTLPARRAGAPPRRRAAGLAPGAFHDRATPPARDRRGRRAVRPAPGRSRAPLPAEGPGEVRDVTRQFNAMRGELARTRRAETELLANLRHDLRTPLTVIGGFAEALVDGTASGEAVPRAARAIADETARLERLVGELGALDGLRDDSATLRPEQLEAGAMLADAAPGSPLAHTTAGVTLVTEKPIVALPFAADRLAMERILSNLLENALAAVGPAVTGVAAPRVHLAARTAMTPDGRTAVALSVSDDGPGFPPGGLCSRVRPVVSG